MDLDSVGYKKESPRSWEGDVFEGIGVNWRKGVSSGYDQDIVYQTAII